MSETVDLQNLDLEGTQEKAEPTESKADQDKKSSDKGSEETLQSYMDGVFKSAARDESGKWNFSDEVRKDPRFAAINAEARRRDTQRSLSLSTARLDGLVEQLVKSLDFTDEQKEQLTEAQGDHKKYQDLIAKFTKANRAKVEQDVENLGKEADGPTALRSLEKEIGIPFSKDPYNRYIPEGLLDQFKGGHISQDEFVRTALGILKSAKVNVKIPKKAVEFLNLSNAPGSHKAEAAGKGSKGKEAAVSYDKNFVI